MQTTLPGVRARACTGVRSLHVMDPGTGRPRWDSRFRPHVGHKPTQLAQDRTSYNVLKPTGTSIYNRAYLRNVASDCKCNFTIAARILHGGSKHATESQTTVNICVTTQSPLVCREFVLFQPLELARKTVAPNPKTNRHSICEGNHHVEITQSRETLGLHLYSGPGY